MSRGSSLLLALVAAPLAAAAPALRVKASPAVAPCVVAAGLEYERATGRRLAVETVPVGLPSSADGADVVVAADEELNRIVESGVSHPELDRELARIPWVLVGPPGTAAPELAALGRSTSVVRSLDGVVARETWRRLRLQGFSPGRVERVGPTPLRLRPGEAAVVPLSLAGPGPVATLDVPPLSAHAVAVAASPRKEAARAFVDFLSGGNGNAAFRACGREDAP